VDIVLLPGNSLVSIDFQPLSREESYLTGPLYANYRDRLQKWLTVLPCQPVPTKVATYFSPLCLFAQFPPTQNAALFDLVGEALYEYIDCYLMAAGLQSSAMTGDGKANEDSLLCSSDRKQVLWDYLEYRTVNDPAKKLLTGAFGQKWTEDVLSQVLFPKDICCR